MFGLSFLIPSYNPVLEELQNLISLILKSTNDLNYEIIVTDDSDNDIRIEKIRDCFDERQIQDHLIIKKVPRLSLLEKRCYLIEEAKYDFFTFMDADDEIKVTNFREFLNKMKREHLDLLEFSFFVKDETGKERRTSKICERTLSSYISTLLKTDETNSLCNKIYRKSVVCLNEHENKQLPKINLGEDKVLNTLLLKNICAYAFVDCPYYVYKLHACSISRSLNLEKRCLDTIEKYCFYKDQNLVMDIFKDASIFGQCIQKDFCFLILSITPKKQLLKADIISLINETENSLNHLYDKFWNVSKKTYIPLCKRIFLSFYHVVCKILGSLAKRKRCQE